MASLPGTQVAPCQLARGWSLANVPLSPWSHACCSLREANRRRYRKLEEAKQTASLTDHGSVLHRPSVAAAGVVQPGTRA